MINHTIGNQKLEFKLILKTFSNNCIFLGSGSSSIFIERDSKKGLEFIDLI